MSETVHYKGILIEMEKLKNETLENQCKRLLNNVELSDYCDTYQEMFEDEFYQQYFIFNNIIYKVDNKQDIDPDDSIFIANKNENGTIEFEVKYYNGGCSFNEALEEALENMETQ